MSIKFEKVSIEEVKTNKSGGFTAKYLSIYSKLAEFNKTRDGSIEIGSWYKVDSVPSTITTAKKPLFSMSRNININRVDNKMAIKIAVKFDPKDTTKINIYAMQLGDANTPETAKPLDTENKPDDDTDNIEDTESKPDDDKDRVTLKRYRTINTDEQEL